MHRSLRFVTGVALLLILSACAAAPPSTPTAPPPTPTVATAATAATTVAGTIESVAGRELTLTTTNGAHTVDLDANARIEQEGKGTPMDLKPGLSVGVTGKPDGTAQSIRIFPAALGTPRPGQFPMTGANQGNTMTNSVIHDFDGKTLTVTFGTNTVTITVPPDTEVLKPVPAVLTDLQTGKRVLAVGAASPDGILHAASVNIVGAPPS